MRSKAHQLVKADALPSDVLGCSGRQADAAPAPPGSGEAT
jgi:hypothetical protein